MERRSDVTLLRSEVRVSRTQRQSIGFAYGRHLKDVDRYIQVLHELADHGELLRVFLAKVRAVGLDNIEQLQHHGCDAAKMPWTKLAAQVVADLVYLHESALRAGIHLRGGRRKYDVHV